MEYGSIQQFIQQDIGDGKEFWISGYANPMLKLSAKANVPPTLVTMYKNNADKPHRTGVYQYDKKNQYYVAKNKKGKIMPVNSFIYVYDTEEEAIAGYNQDLDEVISKYENRINNIRKNIIAN